MVVDIIQGNLDSSLWSIQPNLEITLLNIMNLDSVCCSYFMLVSWVFTMNEKTCQILMIWRFMDVKPFKLQWGKDNSFCVLFYRLQALFTHIISSSIKTLYGWYNYHYLTHKTKHTNQKQKNKKSRSKIAQRNKKAKSGFVSYSRLHRAPNFISFVQNFLQR